MKGLGSFFLLLTLPFLSLAQVSEGETLDRIVAVVGGEIVLKSEVEAQKEQSQQQQMGQGMQQVGADSECGIMDRLMYRKIMLHQAKVDSIMVSESRVESEMDRRIRYFAQQIGSMEKLEEFYGMSVQRIKEEFKSGIKEQLRVQRMQQKITEDVNVTPSEVKEFYHGLPEDSIPLIDASVRIAHIVKRPEIGSDAYEEARQELLEFKERIESGEKSFSVLATLYSEDPGSAENGGELGFIERGEMAKEFEAAVFNLDEGEFSDVIRTENGLHLAQVQEKRGQRIKVRHILLKPQVSSDELDRVKARLDTIARRVRVSDTLDFETAAQRFSDDEKSRRSGGLIVNRESGSSRFKMEELDPEVTFAIENLKVGEISEPIPYQMEGKRAFRIVKLIEENEPHRATLDRDYRFLRDKAKEKEEDRMMREWVNERIKETHVRVDDGYRSCKFHHDWLEKKDSSDQSMRKQ